VIGSGATLEGYFGSTGRFQKVEINHINYETWNRLHNAYTMPTLSSLSYFVLVCLTLVNILAKATRAVPFSIGKARGWKDWIDVTVYELSCSHPAILSSCGGNLTGKLETIDTPR
jgi:hypothetical protein